MYCNIGSPITALRLATGTGAAAGGAAKGGGLGDSVRPCRARSAQGRPGISMHTNVVRLLTVYRSTYRIAVRTCHSRYPRVTGMRARKLARARAHLWHPRTPGRRGPGFDARRRLGRSRMSKVNLLIERLIGCPGRCAFAGSFRRGCATCRYPWRNIC